MTRYETIDNLIEFHFSIVPIWLSQIYRNFFYTIFNVSERFLYDYINQSITVIYVYIYPFPDLEAAKVWKNTDF